MLAAVTSRLTALVLTPAELATVARRVSRTCGVKSLGSPATTSAVVSVDVAKPKTSADTTAIEE